MHSQLEVKVKAVSHARVLTCVVVRGRREKISYIFIFPCNFLVSFRQFGMGGKRREERIKFVKFENEKKFEIGNKRSVDNPSRSAGGFPFHGDYVRS